MSWEYVVQPLDRGATYRQSVVSDGIVAATLALD
jgi:hypothetical protein